MLSTVSTKVYRASWYSLKLLSCIRDVSGHLLLRGFSCSSSVPPGETPENFLDYAKSSSLQITFNSYFGDPGGRAVYHVGLQQLA
jgi:hypothetical protein